MDYPVVLFANNAMICSYCKCNFYVDRGETSARHPLYEDYEEIKGLFFKSVLANVKPNSFGELLQTCLNAGKVYKLPICNEVSE